MAVIAGITMLGAALAALAQDDIKRVLAYSTVSQLAYMLGGARRRLGRRGGVPPADPRRLQGAAVPRRRLGHPRGRHQPDAGHGRAAPADAGHVRDDDGRARRARRVCRRSPGSSPRRRCSAPPRRPRCTTGPVASWAGWLVLVVGAAHRRGHGRLRDPAVADDVLRPAARRRWLAHEPSPAMRWPLVVLAVPAVAARSGRSAVGMAAGVAGPGASDRHRVDRRGRGRAVRAARRAGHLGAVGRAGAGRRRCGRSRLAAGSWHATRRSRCGGRPALEHAFYVDDLYDRAFVRPVRAAARAVRWTDDSVVVAGVLGSGRGARLRSAGWCARTQAGNVHVLPHRAARRRPADRRRRGGVRMT